MAAANLRYALRALMKQPVFSAIVVITFALGIGANTAVFSVLNAVLLRPLPLPQSEQLAEVGTRDTRDKSLGKLDLDSVSYPDFSDWRAQNNVFTEMGVYDSGSFTLTAKGEATHLPGALVSSGLFQLLGVQPILGRTFLANEDQPGAHVVILSHSLWQRRFGGDPAVLGQNITLNGRGYEIVGVMPAVFQFPVQNEPVELWTTIASLRETASPGETPMTAQRENQFLHCIARLKSGVKIDQARANLEMIAAALAKQYPDSNLHTATKIIPLMAGIVGNVRLALLMLLGAAACVLLISCVNVANLLVARSMARQKELSIRCALGARRGQIVRQLLTESVLLALIGGGAGVLLALWGVESLTSLLPRNFPRAAHIRLDQTVLLFATGISLLTGCLAGLAPGLRGAQSNLLSSLNETARGSTETGRGRRFRAVLVVIEIVLALALLSAAGLLVQTFLRLQAVKPGYDPHNVITARLALPDARYPKPPQAAEFYRNLLARAATLPGVVSASASWRLPLSGNQITLNLDIEERPLPKSQQPVTDVDVVALNYFRTMRIPLRRGRDFTERDNENAPNVAIVSETFVKRFFPNEDPIGKRIKPAGSVAPGDPPMRQIIGVVADARALSLRETPNPEVYLPHAQFAIQSMAIMARTDHEPHALLPALRRILTETDKDVPLYNPSTLEDYFASSVAQPRFNALLVALFSSVALLLAAAGIYGVMNYSVTQRTQEIGIRLALGAQRSDVLRLIIGEGMRLVALGVIFGFIAIVAFTRVLQGLLYGIGATHLPTLAAVTCLLAFVALLACWWPARRASIVDPVIALRSE